MSIPHEVKSFGVKGSGEIARSAVTAVTTGRQQLLSPEQATGGGSGEGLFSRRGAIRCTAARAIAGACLPCAAPNNVGAVHHDMSPDTHAIRRTGLLFFCEASGQPKKTNLKIIHN